MAPTVSVIGLSSSTSIATADGGAQISLGRFSAAAAHQPIPIDNIHGPALGSAACRQAPMPLRSGIRFCMDRMGKTARFRGCSK